MQRVEALSRRRQWLALAAAAGFLVWQGALASRGALHPSVHLVVSLLAFLLFAGCLIAGLRTGRSVRGTPTERALNDEMTQRNRLSALGTGFWAMLAAATAFFAGAEVLRLNIGAAAAAQIIMTIGVVAALARFALLEGVLERD